MLAWLYRKWVDESWHILLKRFWAGILEKKNELFIWAFVCGEGSIILSLLLDEPLVFKWTPDWSDPHVYAPFWHVTRGNFRLDFVVIQLRPSPRKVWAWPVVCWLTDWLAGMSADGERKITGGYALCTPLPSPPHHHPTCDQLSTG